MEVKRMAKKGSLKQRGEDAASAYLERVGICVVERDWRHGSDGVHMIAWDADQLVFVDVKTSRASRHGGSQAVSAGTVRRIKRLARAYLKSADLANASWRYDRVDLLLIGEDRALLRHHRDALTHPE
jgi:putative endonuclease